MRPILALLVVVALAAEDLPPGWDRAALTARDDVVLEVWRTAGEPDGRVVLRNRTDLEVRVGYRVAADLTNDREYVTVIGPRATLGIGEAIPVPIGNQVQPAIAITAVARLPISESEGYVRMAEDVKDGVSAWIYRRVDGGNRAYLVLRNPGARALEIDVRLSGLDDREQVRRERIPARATRGDDGALLLTYQPAAPPYATPVRIDIEAVRPAP